MLRDGFRRSSILDPPKAEERRQRWLAEKQGKQFTLRAELTLEHRGAKEDFEFLAHSRPFPW
jgi:hypothetical protein